MKEENYSDLYLIDVLKANNRMEFVESYYMRLNTLAFPIVEFSEHSCVFPAHTS